MSDGALKVLHVVRRFDPLLGGLERYVGDLARAQVARGHRVTVATLDHDVNGVTPGRLTAREEVRGVRIVRLPGIGSARSAVTLRPDLLARLVRQTDVTHVHDMRFMLGSVIALNRLRSRPTFFHTHGLIYGTRRLWAIKRIASRLYYEPVLRTKGTYVVASSPADLARLREFLPSLAAKTVTVMNGVDLGAFQRLSRRPRRAEIAVVGRVAEIKGIDRLLHAIPDVAHPWRLRIHGADEQGEAGRLINLAKSLGIADRIEFTGPFSPEQEPELWRTAALGVFPSTSEAMGMALVDAMAAGVPVLASDIAGHRDALGPLTNEATVDFERPAEVAAAIDRMLNATDAQLAERSIRLKIRAQALDVKRLSDEIDELYRSAGI